MGLNKRIHTAFHLNGKHAFDDRPKVEKQIIWELLKRRHEMPRKQEVVGDFVVMLGEMVREPTVEANYVVFDAMTDSQQLVRVYHENSIWYVSTSGSTARQLLIYFAQPYYRWVLVHPLTQDVLDDLRNRKG